MKRAQGLTLMLLSLLGACSLLSGCLTGCGPEGKQVKALMRMSTQERLTALAKLTPDKQLEMYFYGQRYEPPANFQFYIAPNWRSLLPVVKQRFASESSEKKLANMVALLTAISITQCSLVERRDLLELASRVVAKMQDHPYKEWAAGDLNTVTHPTKQLPPCQ